MEQNQKLTFNTPLSMRIAQPSPCSYIRGNVEQRLATDISKNPEYHNHLARAGFRRVENLAYRPVCPNCQQCIPMRIASGTGDKGELIISKSQRRILQRNAKLTRQILPNEVRDDHFMLFRRYLDNRHHDGLMVDMDLGSYSSMIETSPVQSAIIEYRDSGQLFGVVLIDVQDDGISAVYSFFDPYYKNQSPGIFMVLDCAAVTYEMGLSFVYLGYYIKASRKMNYKKQFKPAQILWQGQWIPLTADS